MKYARRVEAAGARMEIAAKHMRDALAAVMTEGLAEFSKRYPDATVVAHLTMEDDTITILRGAAPPERVNDQTTIGAEGLRYAFAVWVAAQEAWTTNVLPLPYVATFQRGKRTDVSNV